VCLPGNDEQGSQQGLAFGTANPSTERFATFQIDSKDFIAVLLASWHRAFTADKTGAALRSPVF
jgi:hypothetical protein